MTTQTRRVHFGLTLQPGSGSDFCCEVTKTSDPGNAAEFAVELISGDYEQGDDLEAIEEAAIRQAESDWAELAKLEGAA